MQGGGLLFTDAEFRALIMDQYLSKYRDVEDAPSFQCSNGFVYDFKRRHGFSSRKGRIARRPPTDQTSIQIWTEQISHLLETCDRDRILNCDETSWTVFPNNILTWADVGAECVPLKVNGDEKNCLTALATVTANGGTDSNAGPVNWNTALAGLNGQSTGYTFGGKDMNNPTLTKN